MTHLVVRPARPDDLAALVLLAGQAGVGLTTLPRDETLLRQRLEESQSAMAAGQCGAGGQRYLFVLEDRSKERVAGTCGLVSAVGMANVFYNYRVGTTVYASRELGVRNAMTTLYLSNDLTGCSELGTLFLDPQYRRDGLGRLLSRSRYLFIAAHRGNFADSLIAELRGVADASGYSPFWEGLGRHYFKMDFATADALSAAEMQAFIAELMPRQQLDTVLLPESARAVIGSVHGETEPARRLLEREGFAYRGYVDIFDAGPVLQVDTDQIATLRGARQGTVQIAELDDSARPTLMSTGLLDTFCCVSAPANLGQDVVTIEPETARTLGVTAGESLTFVAE